MPSELTAIKQALEDWLDEDPEHRTHVLTEPEVQEILRTAKAKKQEPKA